MSETLKHALDDLQQAEAEYRLMHDRHGDGAQATGRAWDLMRRAGDKARELLDAMIPTPGEDKPLGIEEVVETLELRVAAREAELEAYNERILTLKAENDALREALHAIILRGPERDLKWAGMKAHDIARAALSGASPPPLGV